VLPVAMVLCGPVEVMRATRIRAEGWDHVIPPPTLRRCGHRRLRDWHHGSRY
jgi:hypothetical protein